MTVPMVTLPILIGLGLLALVIGAVFALAMGGRGWGIAALKGLMASVFGTLLMFHLVPESITRLGGWALLWIALGFLSMVALERVLPGEHHAETSIRFFTAEMVWVGLLLHQLTDGVALALAAPEMANDPSLALMVIAHRIPVAAIVMWLFAGKGSARGGWLRLAGMGLATVVGALFAASLGRFLDTTVMNVCYALVAGLFTHLMIHDFIDFHAHRNADKTSEFIAFIAGLALFVGAQWLMSQGHHDAHDHAGAQLIAALVQLIRATAPYLLLGLLMSGIVYSWMPNRPMGWLRGGGPVAQASKGMRFGLPLPICSCGVIPLFVALSKRGVPTAALIAFLVATPELGIDSFLISVKLLGWRFSLIRLVVAVVAPVAIACLAHSLLGQPKPADDVGGSCCSAQAGTKPWWSYAAIDLVDDIFPLILLGLMVAALAQIVWPVEQLTNAFGGADVLVLGLLGIPFYVCASASVPVALVLLQHGFSVGGVLVFLFAGPATNISTVLAVDRVFGSGKGWQLAAIALAVAVAIGFGVNGIIGAGPLGFWQGETQEWAWWEIGSVGVIALLTLGSMWRAGPLHWLSSMGAILPGLVHHPPVDTRQ